MITIAPGLTYLTRADWGAYAQYPRLGYAVPAAQRTEAIVHHTVIVDSDATKNVWETLDEVKAKMRQLQVIRPDLGLDVPYNFVGFLMSDGALIVCEGRGRDRTGAHTYGHNTSGIALSMQGNFQLATPGLVGYAGHISRFWGWLRYDQGLTNLGSKRPARALVYGHRDLAPVTDPTACPGTYLYALLPGLSFAKEEEDEMKLHLIQGTGTDKTVYLTDGVHKRRANSPHGVVIADLEKLGVDITVIAVSDVFVTWLTPFPEDQP